MKMKLRGGIGSLMVAAGMIVNSSQAVAQTSAIASGNWSDPLTWSAGEPSQTLSALVDGSFTVTVNQAGEATNLLDVGTAAGQTGNVDITGGDLTVSNVVPADFPSSIRLGQVAGSTGNLTMSAGTVAINGAVGSGFAIADALIGDNGTGTMTLTGGNFTAADEVFVALGGSSDGTLNVSGGTLNVAGRNLLVAFFGGANGKFNLSGTGIVNVDEFLFTSFDPGATSMLTQTGGTLTIGQAFVLGRNGNASYTHSGGTINVPAVGGNGDFVAGDGGLNNVFNISDSATVNAGRHVLVAAFGGSQSTVNQTGGTINADGGVFVGRDGTGTWNMSGGVLNQNGTGNENNNLFVGRDGGPPGAQGTGTFNQSAGTVNIAGNVFLGDFDHSEGTYNISGGELHVAGNLNVGAALASNAVVFPPGHALNADGTFVVSGAGGVIDVAGDLLANPDDNPRFGGGGEHNDSTLVFEILDGSGVSLIDVTGVADLTGADIDVDVLGGSFGFGSTFDLITATSISADYLQVAEDLGSISLSIVGGGNGQILRATLVPEPSSLAMVAVGLVAALGWVRQRRSLA
jgi:hypothetical protein